MENRQETTRLERQVRRWRTATISLGVLVMVGGPLGAVVAQVQAADAARLGSARATEIATIDIPAGFDGEMPGTRFGFEPAQSEITLSGPSQLGWKNGLKIRTQKATVRMVRDRNTGATRLFIEPAVGPGR